MGLRRGEEVEKWLLSVCDWRRWSSTIEWHGKWRRSDTYDCGEEDWRLKSRARELLLSFFPETHAQFALPSTPSAQFSPSFLCSVIFVVIQQESRKGMRCRERERERERETQCKSLPHHHQASVVPDSLYVFFAYLFSSPDVSLFLPPSDSSLDFSPDSSLPCLSLLHPLNPVCDVIPGISCLNQWKRREERSCPPGLLLSSLPHIMFSSLLSCLVMSINRAWFWWPFPSPVFPRDWLFKLLLFLLLPLLPGSLLIREEERKEERRIKNYCKTRIVKKLYEVIEG